MVVPMVHTPAEVHSIVLSAFERQSKLENTVSRENSNTLCGDAVNPIDVFAFRHLCKCFSDLSS